jgi:hypothetical protein
MLQEASRPDTNSKKETKAKFPETKAYKEIYFKYDDQGLMSSKDNVNRDYFYDDFACHVQ